MEPRPSYLSHFPLKTSQRPKGMMVPSTAIKICIREKYFDFSSRASRSEFWFYTIFVLVFTTLASYCALEFGPLLGTWVIPFSVLNNPLFELSDFLLIWPNIFGWLLLIVDLLFSIPLLSAQVRRIHDVGKSGWWLLIGQLEFSMKVERGGFGLLQGILVNFPFLRTLYG